MSLPDVPSAAVRRVAYLVSQYPAFSHAFIANEIEALALRGWSVEAFSVTEPSLPDAPGATPTYVLQRDVAPTLVKVLRHLVGDPGALVRGAKAVASIVRDQPSRSAKGALKQLAYLYEAFVLVRELDRRGLDHVHVHFANSAADVARLAKAVSRRRLTWSMTIHGPADFENGTRADLRGKAKAADALFCISEFARGELAGFARAGDAARALVCRMGVSISTMALATSQVKSDGDADVLRVLFVGRLVAKKDPAGLLAAVVGLAERPENASRRVELTIVGDGPERAVLEEAAKAVPGNVTVALTGAESHDAVLAHYSVTDVFCLPSYSEGLPVVVMEALAAELAVVATPVAAIPELVIEGRTGMLVAPGDTGALVDALQALWDSAELRRTLGAQGRSAVEAEFVSTKASLVLDGVFTELTSAGASGRS